MRYILSVIVLLCLLAPGYGKPTTIILEKPILVTESLRAYQAGQTEENRLST